MSGRILKFRKWDDKKFLFWEQDDCDTGFWDVSYPTMQYTGLLDKQGVEIYEGDILDAHQTINGINLFIVVYENLGFTIRYVQNSKIGNLYEYDVIDFFKPCQFSGEVDFEVIGNIYEDKEKLK